MSAPFGDSLASAALTEPEERLNSLKNEFTVASRRMLSRRQQLEQYMQLLHDCTAKLKTDLRDSEGKEQMARHDFVSLVDTFEEAKKALKVSEQVKGTIVRLMSASNQWPLTFFVSCHRRESVPSALDHTFSPQRGNNYALEENLRPFAFAGQPYLSEVENVLTAVCSRRSDAVQAQAHAAALASPDANGNIVGMVPSLSLLGGPELPVEEINSARSGSGTPSVSGLSAGLAQRRRSNQASKAEKDALAVAAAGRSRTRSLAEVGARSRIGAEEDAVSTPRMQTRSPSLVPADEPQALPVSEANPEERLKIAAEVYKRYFDKVHAKYWNLLDRAKAARARSLQTMTACLQEREDLVVELHNIRNVLSHIEVVLDPARAKTSVYNVAWTAAQAVKNLPVDKQGRTLRQLLDSLKRARLNRDQVWMRLEAKLNSLNVS